MPGRTSRPLVVGLIAAVLTTLSACGTTSTPAPRRPLPPRPRRAPARHQAPPAPAPPRLDRVEITFWSWVPGIEDQVNAFNASQTAIQVKYVNTGAGNAEYAALNTALQANTDVPDVVQIEFQHLPSFIARGELAEPRRLRRQRRQGPVRARGPGRRSRRATASMRTRRTPGR